MDSILKINCVFNLSMIFASLYFVARARFRHEIRKHIDNKFTFISILISIVGVLSWYAFYFNCKVLLFSNLENISHSMTMLFIFKTIINVLINIFIWYIFVKFKKQKNE